MTPEEQAKKIEQIYNEAMRKIAELSNQHKEFIHNYLKELESKKADAIRVSLEAKL